MGKLFVIMGKSASGKDTLYRLIMERHPELRPVVPYTTRPIRAGEKEGREYHFVTDETLHRMEKENRVVECRCYETVKGLWNYFTADDGQINLEEANSCLISTLEGYMGIRNYYGVQQVVPLYIAVDDFVRMDRSLKREKEQKNPCVAEVCRRFLADEADFSEEKLQQAGITEEILNVSLQEALEEIEKRIDKSLQK
ncbi:MAG: guanylate kinase [Eubacterium sp.]|nr:guanylate kinase [Eubacterium sp.]